jgi:hypothetical protein
MLFRIPQSGMRNNKRFFSEVNKYLFNMEQINLQTRKTDYRNYLLAEMSVLAKNFLQVKIFDENVKFSINFPGGNKKPPCFGGFLFI